MALLYISEFQGVAQVHGGMSAPMEPCLLDQVPIGIAGGPQSSQPFTFATKLIRVHCDSICSIAIGPPVVTVATTNNARMATNQTEYFGVLPGHILSVIANT